MSVSFDVYLAGAETSARYVPSRRRNIVVRVAIAVGEYVMALVETTTYLTVYVGVAGGMIWLTYFAYISRRA
jgi:hypothetical protein